MAWLYAHDKAFKVPYQDNLSAFIFEPSFRQQVGDALFTKAKLIKDLGNMAILQAKPDFASLRERIQRIAIELEGQMAISAIKAEAMLIQALTSDEWWEGVTVPMLETVRRRLRGSSSSSPRVRKGRLHRHRLAAGDGWLEHEQIQGQGSRLPEVPRSASVPAEAQAQPAADRDGLG